MARKAFAHFLADCRGHLGGRFSRWFEQGGERRRLVDQEREAWWMLRFDCPVCRSNGRRWVCVKAAWSVVTLSALEGYGTDLEVSVDIVASRMVMGREGTSLVPLKAAAAEVQPGLWPSSQFNAQTWTIDGIAWSRRDCSHKAWCQQRSDDLEPTNAHTGLPLCSSPQFETPLPCCCCQLLCLSLTPDPRPSQKTLVVLKLGVSNQSRHPRQRRAGQLVRIPGNARG